MIILVVAIILLGLVTYYFHRRDLKREATAGPQTEAEKSPEPPQECCGQHLVCERDSLLAAVSKKIEYYDDEELDRFRGTAADAYDDAAVDEFRDVLYTLKDTEVAGWLRSLQLRAVNLPDALKDEAFLIVGERRIH